MTWCNESEDHEGGMQIVTPTFIPQTLKPSQNQTLTCPSCGHNLQFLDQGSGLHELPGLPAGVKFDPNDTEILEHLEAKAASDVRKLHPLIDQFIPTLEGENGICYTHPEKLPGVSKDGQIRHFFHRPSKAYTTGTRKRRKVHTDEEGSETRWHKTGKTRPIYVNGTVKGFKKILVLYTNYGRKRKPEKTSWVMHQYHIGIDEEEKEGELVVSKVFYQTQPRQCGSNNSISNVKDVHYDDKKTFNDGNNDAGGGDRYSNAMMGNKNNGSCGGGGLEYYGSSGYVNYELHNNVHVVGPGVRETSPQLIPNLVVHGDAASSFFSFTSGSYKQSKTM